MLTIQQIIQESPFTEECRIIEKYEDVIRSSQTKDINADNFITPLEIKIMKESIPILKEKLLNELKKKQTPRRRRT